MIKQKKNSTLLLPSPLVLNPVVRPLHKTPPFDPSARPCRSTLSILTLSFDPVNLTPEHCSTNDLRVRQQQRRPRPSRSEREQRRTSTQVNLLANRLPQVNQDFLNLARTQLEAFNQLQREGCEQNRSHSRARTCSPSPPRVTASYRQRPSLLPSGIRTPPTPRRPSSSPEPPREDLETLPDAPEQHSPTPSVMVGILI